MNTLVLDPTQDPEQDTAVHRAHEHKAIAAAAAIQLERSSDGIGWLTFDTPRSSVNVFNESTLRELDGHLEAIEEDPSIKALVIRSAKERVFIAGADLKAIRSLPQDRLDELIDLGQAVFSRLASVAVPKIAVIHGACVGGGLEVALACDYRIASDSEATRLGLPEVQIGLIPAWGGSTRLPRLIGLPRALDLILTGKLVRAAQARKLGIVDHVVPREHLEAMARKVVQLSERGPGRPKIGRRLLPLLSLLPLPQVIGWKARRGLLAKTRGLYPAPLKALDVVTWGYRRSFSDSLALERAGIRELARRPETLKLIDLFFRKEDASKKLPAVGTPKPVSSAVVVGAGVMGAGIAHWLGSQGIGVLMTDVSTEAIAKGLSRVSSLLDEGVRRRAISRKEARDALDRISTSHEKVSLHQPIVIEAATERLELKKQIFADLAARTGADAILATNTSALSVTDLAECVPHPERVIGLHFFNPVHRMPLVEIITHSQTAPDVLSTTVAFAQRIGKTPVVVRDSPGFVVNRILMPYLMEAVRLFEAGAPAALVDEAMLDFGMPMGPLRLLDEIGIDVAGHVGATLVQAFPDRLPHLELLDRLVAAGRLGRKAGLGFFTYAKGKQGPAPSVSDLVRKPEPAAPNDVPAKEEIQQRLALLLGNEAVRCLDEGVVAAASDIDLAMVLGTGYPPFRGGPIAWVSSFGPANAAAALEKFAAATPTPNPFTPAASLLSGANL